MDKIFIVFMAFVSVVCLFAVLVITRDIIRESAAGARERRLAKKEEREALMAKRLEQQPVAQPVKEEKAEVKVEEKVEEVVATEVAEPAEEVALDGAVTFSADKGQTLDDKYHALTSDNKNYYDDIIKYASAVEDSKRFKNMRYEEYKIGSSRIVRLTIKRGVIHCEFMMQNMNFKNYVAENKISVRQSATVIKVTDGEVVQTVKDTIDIVVKAIAEEREFKKQLAREKRRQRKAEQEEK